jgi:hypothetical protein
MQRLFERRSSLEAQFGCGLAKLICRRMGVLQEATRLSSIPTCRPPECQREDNGCWSVALGDTHRLAFRAIPASRVNNTDAIKQIQIVGVISS